MTESTRNWPHRIALGPLIEFSAALSIVVLVAGYIWNHLVISVAGAPNHNFSISDYLNSGAAASVLLSSIGFVSFLSYAVTMPWEQPLSERTLRKFSYAYVVMAIVVGLIAVGIGFYMGSRPGLLWVPKFLSMLIKISAVVIVFLLARRFAPLRANSTTLSLVVAVGVWTSCASSAVNHATRAWEPANPRDPVVHYEFEGEELVSTDWYKLLDTEQSIYFVHRVTGEARIKPVERLLQIWQAGSVRD